MNVFQEGQTDSFSKTISESDIYLFAGITGDLNPVHVDQEFASTTKFGKRIAHGMLSSGLICTVLGMKLPGPGTIHMKQSLTFKAPVFIGDTITAKAEILSINQEKNEAIISTNLYNQNGILITEGEALVKLPKHQ